MQTPTVDQTAPSQICLQLYRFANYWHSSNQFGHFIIHTWTFLRITEAVANVNAMHVNSRRKSVMCVIWKKTTLSDDREVVTNIRVLPNIRGYVQHIYKIIDDNNILNRINHWANQQYWEKHESMGSSVDFENPCWNVKYWEKHCSFPAIYRSFLQNKETNAKNVMWRSPGQQLESNY